MNLLQIETQLHTVLLDLWKMISHAINDWTILMIKIKKNVIQFWIESHNQESIAQ